MMIYMSTTYSPLHRRLKKFVVPFETIAQFPVLLEAVQNGRGRTKNDPLVTGVLVTSEIMDDMAKAWVEYCKAEGVEAKEKKIHDIFEDVTLLRRAITAATEFHHPMEAPLRREAAKIEAGEYSKPVAPAPAPSVPRAPTYNITRGSRVSDDGPGSTSGSRG